MDAEIESKGTINIWTIQMGQWRIAKERGIAMLNITAMNGIKAFAPDFNDVMAYKKGLMTEEKYLEIYQARMDASRINNPEVWKKLSEFPDVAVACYCRAGAFCHRHPFTKMMTEYLTKFNYNVVLKGELTK